MMRLPAMLRKLPFVIYGLCALFFVWSLGNSWVQMTSYGQYPDTTLGGVMVAQKSEALFRAAVDSIFLLTNAAILHVLIAIHDKPKGPAE